MRCHGERHLCSRCAFPAVCFLFLRSFLYRVNPLKVVGDLAQMMVAQDLSQQDVLERAGSLDFPLSVIEFMQGAIGIP